MSRKRKSPAPIELADAPTRIPADQMFVRVPLPPEIVVIVRKHVDAAGGLFALGRGVLELALGTSDAARVFLEGCAAAAVDVQKDAQRLRRPKKRARRR